MVATKNNRRDFLSKVLFGYGGLGLKSLLIGLPPGFIMSRVIGQEARTRLIYCFQKQGDPIGCNFGPAYDIPECVHPAAFETPVLTSFGDNSIQCAAPWASLPQDFRAKSHMIFHHTGAAAHPESNVVLAGFSSLKGQGGVGSEMLPSIHKDLFGDGLSIIHLTNKFSLTEGGSSPIPQIAPNSLKSAFSLSDTQLLNIRDKALNELWKECKASGNTAQWEYCDKMIMTSSQSRELAKNLSGLLENVETLDTFTAAVIVMAAGASSVATIHIPFGGDNHDDQGLTKEANQLSSGCQQLESLWNLMKQYNIHTTTTFAMQGVFGRTFGLKNGAKNGRDHHGGASTTLIQGPNVKGGLSGGLIPISGKKAAETTGINSKTGQATNSGDIPKNETLAAACRTVLKVCGASESELEERVRGGKLIESAIL
ncbi:MAG: DUF1501 domain-containing protein [Oligoflexales bacterium]